MSRTGDKNLKLAGYAGALFFSGMVWFGVFSLIKAVTGERPEDAVATDTGAPVETAARTQDGPDPDAGDAKRRPRP